MHYLQSSELSGQQIIRRHNRLLFGSKQKFAANLERQIQLNTEFGI